MSNHSNPYHSLAPKHLAYLKERGLSDDTIDQAEFYSVPPRDIQKKLGRPFQNVESVLAIPCGKNERYRLFPPQGRMKFYQPKGTPSLLYFTPASQAVLNNATIPIYITEGEIKSLKASQEGFPCLGLTGLWCWSDGSEEKKLIPDFDLISWKGRTVYIVPDNDWELPDRHGEERNLRQAVYGLAHHLIDRGARVSIVELPQGAEKVGLDDYLCNHSVDEFKVLPKKGIRKFTIKEMIQEASLENLRDILKRLLALPETEKAVYINALAKKLSISKRSIQKDIDALSRKKDETPDVGRLLESGANPKSNFSAQNFNDCVLSYGVILGSERILVRSDGEIILADGSKGDSFRFRRSTLTVGTIKRFRAGEDVDGKNLLNRIQRLLTDHVIFKDTRFALLIGIWVLGTYLFKAFRFFGYLWINSPIKRCGKSLLLDILSLVTFNATPRLVNPSEASVFREVDSNDATLIIDEVESLSHGEKNEKSEMISLINSGFQRGSLASRVETKNKEFVVTYFNSYCPKILSGIRGIVDTIEDRSFKIPMIRKTKDENIKRFNLRTLDSEIEKIKEDCFIWALRYAGDISDFYDSMPELAGTQNLDDRLKDILEPLLSIAAIIDAQGDDEKRTTVKGLVSLAGDMGRGRENQEALNGSIPAVVNLLGEFINGKDENFISCDDLFSKFQSDDDLSFIGSKKGMAFFLSKLDLHRMPPRKVEGKATRGYRITRAWVDDLRERYA